MNFLQKMQDPSTRTMVMGILNVTPDSFSDGGKYATIDQVKRQVESMVEAGIDIIDVGGESTRPGAKRVGVQEELDRVLPVVELVKKEFAIPVSVDTYKTEVMSEVIGLGVDLVNDVNALQSPGAAELIASSGVAACLMHKQGNPETMQSSPVYKDVVEEVISFLQQRINECQAQGVKPEQIMIDPGFGFGKTLEHNVKLFVHLKKIVSMGYPVLAGVSRKRMIGELLGGAGTEERMVGSVVAAVLAAQKGAKLLRVHDVPETIQAIKIANSLL